LDKSPVRTSRLAMVKRKLLLSACVIVTVIAVVTTGCGVTRFTFGGSSSAKIAAAKADLATMSSAMQAFRLDCDRYPTNGERFDALLRGPKGLKDWKGPYMAKPVPLDPWGHPYVYRVPGPGGSDFCITSYGSDGDPGGSGDAADIAEVG